MNAYAGPAKRILYSLIHPAALSDQPTVMHPEEMRKLGGESAECGVTWNKMDWHEEPWFFIAMEPREGLLSKPSMMVGDLTQSKKRVSHLVTIDWPEEMHKSRKYLAGKLQLGAQKSIVIPVCSCSRCWSYRMCSW